MAPDHLKYNQSTTKLFYKMELFCTSQIPIKKKKEEKKPHHSINRIEQ